MAWANERGTEGPLEGLEAAVHLGGVNLSERRWTPAYKREIETSRVESTRVLAKLLAGLKRPPKTLLVASAAGFYGDRGDEVLDEASGAGEGYLPEICEKWEAASEAAARVGIRVVHMRLGVVLGREGALKKMLPIFRLGLGGRLGRGGVGGAVDELDRAGGCGEGNFVCDEDGDTERPGEPDSATAGDECGVYAGAGAGVASAGDVGGACSGAAIDVRRNGR